MLRLSCARARSLRALAAAVAIGVPLAAASPASADHGSRFRDHDRGSIGTIRIDGLDFCISGERSAAGRIASAFRRLGYDAWADRETVIVRVYRGREPDFRWDGCGYELCRSWRGDCLVLTLEHHATRRVLTTEYYCNERPSVIIRRGDPRCDDPCPPRRGYCPPPPRPIIVTVGPRRHLDDPDWGRRIGPYPSGGVLDRGWGRKWDPSIDKGFGLHWNWASRGTGRDRDR